MLLCQSNPKWNISLASSVSKWVKSIRIFVSLPVAGIITPMPRRMLITTNILVSWFLETLTQQMLQQAHSTTPLEDVSNAL